MTDAFPSRHHLPPSTPQPRPYYLCPTLPVFTDSFVSVESGHTLFPVHKYPGYNARVRDQRLICNDIYRKQPVHPQIYPPRFKALLGLTTNLGSPHQLRRQNQNHRSTVATQRPRVFQPGLKKATSISPQPFIKARSRSISPDADTRGRAGSTTAPCTGGPGLGGLSRE